MNGSTPQRIVAGALWLIAVLALTGIWIGLPARWWPVDGIGTALALASLGGGLGLWLDKPWGMRLARAVLWALLAAGCTTVTALAWVVAHLAGLYGPVGAGGALLMGTMAVLILPYLVALPALSLRLLRESA
jgi:hypothetical protein